MSRATRYLKKYPNRPGSIREAQKQLTRERLIESAIAVMLERGLEATTMEEIAARANLGRTTMYKYFDGKPDLTAAASETQMSDMMIAILSMGEVDPGNLRDLTAWLERFEECYTDLGPWFYLTPPTGESIERSLEQQEQAAQEVLDEWGRRGWAPAVKTPAKSLLLLFTLVGRWLSYKWIYAVAEPEHSREALLDMVNSELMRIMRRRSHTSL